MKIRYWGILFFLLIMLTAAGCERKSVEDIRSMEETKLVGESGSEVTVKKLLTYTIRLINQKSHTKPKLLKKTISIFSIYIFNNI